MKYTIFVLTFMLASIFIFPVSAIVKELDDPYVLATKLKHAKNDREKASLLLDLAEIRLLENAVRSLGKTKLAYVLAKNTKDIHLQFRALCNLIDIYTDHIPDAKIAGEYLKTLKNISLNDLSKKEIARGNVVEAKVFLSLLDYPKAQQSFFKARKLYAKLELKSPVNNINFKLGVLNYNRDDLMGGLVYFNQAFIGFKDDDNQEGEIQALKMLGLSNLQLGHVKEGLEYLNDGLNLSQSIGNDKFQSEMFLVFTKFYFDKSDLDKSLFYLQKAIDINEVNSFLAIDAKIETYKGLIELKKCNKYEATAHLTKALRFIEKTKDNKSARDIYNKMYVFYVDNGDDSLAFSSLQNLLRWNEVVYNEDKARQLITNRVRYESEKIEQENENLKASGLEFKLAYQNQRMQNYALIFLFVIILGGSGFLYYSYRQKQNYNTKLEQIVIDRTEELRLTNHKLSNINEKLGDSNTELERFAYIASHDLKSPLRNIISFVGLATRRLKDIDDEEISEYLQYVRTNAEQMNDLIRDILEFSKVEKEEASKIEVDSNISLCNAVQNINSLIDTKNAKITADILPSFYGQNSQVIQLFQNLISNGIKYNQNKQPQINISHSFIDGNHQFDISDNGIGISEEYKEKVFDMFTRLHTKEEYSGTGIGLAVCKKIVKRLGGEIWLKSEEGIGTTFSFTAPQYSAQ